MGGTLCKLCVILFFFLVQSLGAIESVYLFACLPSFSGLASNKRSFFLLLNHIHFQSIWVMTKICNAKNNQHQQTFWHFLNFYSLYFSVVFFVFDYSWDEVLYLANRINSRHERFNSQICIQIMSLFILFVHVYRFETIVVSYVRVRLESKSKQRICFWIW